MSSQVIFRSYIQIDGAFERNNANSCHLNITASFILSSVKRMIQLPPWTWCLVTFGIEVLSLIQIISKLLAVVYVAIFVKEESFVQRYFNWMNSNQLRLNPMKWFTILCVCGLFIRYDDVFLHSFSELDWTRWEEVQADCCLCINIWNYYCA